MGPLGQWRDGERGAGERADRWARGAGRRARLREGGRLVRGAALTWALGERGDAGACAGRAGWAAAQSWRAECVRVEVGPSGTGRVKRERERARLMGAGPREKVLDWAWEGGLGWVWVFYLPFSFLFLFLSPQLKII